MEFNGGFWQKAFVRKIRNVDYLKLEFGFCDQHMSIYAKMENNGKFWQKHDPIITRQFLESCNRQITCNQTTFGTSCWLCRNHPKITP
jgi:hypothetical protein